MVKYIYNMSKLLPGDIILTRDPNCELSRRVMESTNSDYSHAMIYVSCSSCIGAEKRVQARNLARFLFDDPKNTCVLRIKKEYQTPITIDAAIYYARLVVGNPYSFADALRMEIGRTDSSTFDTQICTRLVAKAFEFSGLRIVDNVEMCTPQEILESRCFDKHWDYLRVANDFDIRFADSYDVTEDMRMSTKKLFDSLKIINEGKIRSMQALTDYVIEHPEVDTTVCELLQQSGYLNVLEIEEEKNTYNYDKNVFVDFYGEDNAYEAAICALEENVNGIYRYEQECKDLTKKYFASGRKLRYLIMMIGLYKQIVEQHQRRIRVCYEVMYDPRS